MIGSTGIYNLDNGDIINSVKVRSIADYYKDDYETDYEAYEKNVENRKDAVQKLQDNLDKKSIELENAQAAIFKYINTATPETEEMLNSRLALQNEITTASANSRTLRLEIYALEDEIADLTKDLDYIDLVDPETKDLTAAKNNVLLLEKKISGLETDNAFWGN
jgi:chromosome segregation ATPase